MSDTPRTALQLQVGRAQGHDGYVHGSFAQVLEGELVDQKARYERDAAALRKELAEVTAAFQKECDHDWEFIDDSFDHELGCQQVHSWRCEKCGASRETKPDDYADPPDVGCDDKELP